MQHAALRAQFDACAVDETLSMTSPGAKIWTSGYEGQTLSGFIARLEGEGIAQVVDIRELPVSRKAGFSRQPLQLALAIEGIGYRHLRALGCPRDVRDRWRQDHDWQRYTEDYLTYMHTQCSALEELADMAAESPLALLCYEAEPAQCHRALVARAIAGRIHADVVHILPDGLRLDSAASVAAVLPV